MTSILLEPALSNNLPEVSRYMVAAPAAASAAASLSIVKVLPYNGIGVPDVKPNPFIVGTYIVINPEFLNTSAPIDVTKSGMAIDVKLVQS